MVDAEGYVRLFRPDHPNAFANGYVHEHVLVAAEKIGRPIREGEEVHHVDLDKANNDPANLSVLTRSAHQLLHRKIERESSKPK